MTNQLNRCIIILSNQTRSDNIIKIDNDSFQRLTKVIQQITDNLTDNQIEKIATGRGTLKYISLKRDADMIFNYIDMNNRNACCHIERHGNLIIATELKENTGASVTNSCERIATQFATEYNISFDSIIFVERYDERSYEGRKPLEIPNYSIVSFSIGERDGKDCFTSPQWKYLSAQEFEELVERQIV